MWSPKKKQASCCWTDLYTDISLHSPFLLSGTRTTDGRSIVPLLSPGNQGRWPGGVRDGGILIEHLGEVNQVRRNNRCEETETLPNRFFCCFMRAHAGVSLLSIACSQRVAVDGHLRLGF
jgi:hypothetical protein